MLIKKSILTTLICKLVLTRTILTLSQTTNFSLFQTEKVVDDIFNKYDENGRKFPKRVENTVGKGEITRYRKILLFQQCFQETHTADT